eukprot:919157-Pyramimonas_sp.AAC.1
MSDECRTGLATSCSQFAGDGEPRSAAARTCRISRCPLLGVSIKIFTSVPFSAATNLFGTPSCPNRRIPPSILHPTAPMNRRIHSKPVSVPFHQPK